MSLANYRSSSHHRLPPIVELFSIGTLCLALMFIGLEYRDYHAQKDDLGNDITMAGLQVGSLSKTERKQLLEQVYLNQPIILDYNGAPIWLYPSDIGAEIDIEAMENALIKQRAIESDWHAFKDFLLRKPRPTVSTELIATYNEEALLTYIDDLAQRYGTSAQTASFDATNYSFTGGTGHTILDQTAAYNLIAPLIFNPDLSVRYVSLPTITFSGEAADMETLRAAIQAYLTDKEILNNSDTIVVSVYVQDLSTGAEMGILPNYQHSSFSTVKIPILINYFRYQITAPSSEEAFMLASAVICSRNNHANEIMRITSPNAIYAEGAEYTTQTACQVGATHTAILSTLWNGSRQQLRDNGFDPDFYYAPAPDTPCPTNSLGTDLEAQESPLIYDSFNRTTAADMGTMLMEIYDCAMYGSGLHTIFPDEITQSECQQILEVLNGTRFEHLAELGVPKEIALHDMYHKVAYGMTNNEAGTSTEGGTGVVADVGIVSSPNTDYVFAIYIAEQDTNYDGIANISRWYNLADISRIIWNFFNPEQSLTQTRVPIRGNFGEGCVLPRAFEDISLQDIDANRFDENDRPLSSACYGYPDCTPYPG